MKRIRGTSPAQWIFLMVVCLLLVGLLILKPYEISKPNRILVMLCSILVTPISIHNLIHVRYLSDYGVECFKLSHVYKKVSWNEIDQICILRDSFIGKGGVSRILVVPKGCAKFNQKVWYGAEYLWTMRHQVIWIDHTKDNLRFIEDHYGTLDPPY